jgi:hypothetical protein
MMWKLRAALPVLAWALLAGAASARMVTLAGSVTPGGAGYADLENAVGPVQYQVSCPEVRTVPEGASSSDYYRERTVTIVLGKAGTAYRDRTILAGLLTQALDAAYQQCRIEERSFDGMTDRGQTGAFEIRGKLTEDGPVTLLAAAEGYSRVYNAWGQVFDVAAEREQEREAAAEAQRKADQRAAEEEADRQAAIAAANARAIREAERAEESRKSSAAFWFWVRMIGLAIAAWFAWANREGILAWYYALKPHPAQAMVESRIYGGGEIDGALFAALVRPVPGHPAEQRVRAEQARRLAKMARDAAQARVQELEHLKAKALKEAEFINAQAELQRAVEGHEMAMARLDAVREWSSRHGR